MNITFDNVIAQAQAQTPYEQAWLDQLRHDTSIMAPGALYMYEYKRFLKTKGKAGWNGRAYSVKRDGSFLAGMLPSVLDKAIQKNILCNVFYTGSARTPGMYYTPTVVLRDYQKKGLNVLLNNHHPVLGWWPRGILQVATGGGKTEMAIALYQTLPYPTLFLVQYKQLLDQTAERFRAYGINPGVIGDGLLHLSSRINIATVQTITSLLKRGNEEIKDVLHNTQQIFFDEAHGIAATIAKGNTLVDISNLMPNAHARWGLTATPFMRDMYSNNLLEGVTGSVLYHISSETLIAQGYLTMPEITMIRSTDVACKTNAWPACYDSGIVLNSGRNDAIAKAVVNSPKPCLIMTTQVAHARIIEKRVRDANVKVGYLDGSCSTTERNQMIADLVQGNIEAIVCTTIFNAGVDIPQLQSLVMAGGGKSKVAQLQKLGRGLRRSIGKPKVVVTDFWDSSTKTLERHSKERKKTWEAEGFNVTIR